MKSWIFSLGELFVRRPMSIQCISEKWTIHRVWGRPPFTLEILGASGIVFLFLYWGRYFFCHFCFRRRFSFLIQHNIRWPPNLTGMSLVKFTGIPTIFLTHTSLGVNTHHTVSSSFLVTPKFHRSNLAGISPQYFNLFTSGANVRPKHWVLAY